jgi:hypothetical protein
MPWSVQSCKILDGANFFVDFQTVDASTIPLSGFKKVNRVWSTIKLYPAMPPDAVSYYAECIDSRKMGEFVTKESDQIFGDGVSDRFSDPIKAFEIGIGREHLGNTIAQIGFGREHFENLKLVSLELERDRSARDYFERYLDALAKEDLDSRGIQAKYETSVHQGFDTIWSDKLIDVRGEILRKRKWYYSQEMGKTPDKMPDDFGKEILERNVDLRRHRAPDREIGQQVPEEQNLFLGKLSGKGVLFTNRWAVLGNWFQVNSVVDWGTKTNSVECSDRLLVDGSTEIFDRQAALSNSAAFHFFSIVRGENTKSTVDFFADLVLRPLGKRGLIRREKLATLSDNEMATLLTDQQKFRLEVAELANMLTSMKPHRIEARYFNKDRSRLTSRITWRFEKPKR